jgi:hypothetical protein
VFNRKQPQVEHVGHTDMIDLLLDADAATRRQLVAQAIETGALSRIEAEDLMAQAARLERVAGPRRLASATEPESQPAWGIDYP